MPRTPFSKKPAIPKLKPTMPHHEILPAPLNALMKLGEEEDWETYTLIFDHLEPLPAEEATQQLLQLALDPTWFDYVDFDTYPEDLDPFEQDTRLSTPIHAVRLLANMRERAHSALEPLTLLLASEDEALAEEVSYYYAHMGEVALPLLTQLLLSQESLPEQRVSIGGALQAMVEMDETKLEVCRTLLLQALAQEQDMDTATCFVAYLIDFGDPSLLPEIERAYEEGRVDASLLPLEEIQSLFSGESATPNDEESDLEEGEEEMEEKAVPYVSAVKVGRNDPCPCGSGKKYKKCCGA